jgi:hypothetical protein
MNELHDIGIYDNMTLLMVKKQLTHLKTKKINEEKCKDPLPCYITYEVHYSYVGFVV